MSIYHVLNGDCLADQLRQTGINQDFIICRECLIDGELKADNLNQFWSNRANYISSTFNEAPDLYYDKVVRELDKLNTLPDHAEVCLWFEHDLFCQTNMWFIISLLSRRPMLKLYRIFPDIPRNENIWKGFGGHTTDALERALAARIVFKPEDILLGNKLWMAFQHADLMALKMLSTSASDCFNYLPQVIQAHIDRFPQDQSLSRPEKLVKQLMRDNISSFHQVFAEFSQQEGIYGFADTQIKVMYDKVMQGEN